MGMVENPATTVGGKFLSRRVVFLDIIGSLTRGQAPHLWEKYRGLLSRDPKGLSVLGLREITGCEDEALYLLSEVMCLEHCASQPFSANNGMDFINNLADYYDIRLAKLQHRLLSNYDPKLQIYELHKLDGEFGEMVADSERPVDEPETLTEGEVGSFPRKEISLAFIIATRIHIWTILLGFLPENTILQSLLQDLARYIKGIQTGPMGFDRCIVWPLIVGGSLSITTEDRDFFIRRLMYLEPFGNLSVAETIVRHVWAMREKPNGVEVHWRTAMKDIGCDILMV